MKYSPLQNDRESLYLNKGRSKTNFFDEVGTVECHILVRMESNQAYSHF